MNLASPESRPTTVAWNTTEYDFRAENPGELSCTYGQYLKVLEGSNHEWLKCMSAHDSQIGLVPFTYVSLIDPSEQQLASQMFQNQTSDTCINKLSSKSEISTSQSFKSNELKNTNPFKLSDQDSGSSLHLDMFRSVTPVQTTANVQPVHTITSEQSGVEAKRSSRPPIPPKPKLTISNSIVSKFTGFI